MFVMAAECLASSCLPRKCLKVCKLICITCIIWMFTTSLEMSCRQVSTCSFYHYLFLINLIHQISMLRKSMITSLIFFCSVSQGFFPWVLAVRVSWKNIICPCFMQPVFIKTPQLIPCWGTGQRWTWLNRLCLRSSGGCKSQLCRLYHCGWCEFSMCGIWSIVFSSVPPRCRQVALSVASDFQNDLVCGCLNLGFTSDCL